MAWAKTFESAKFGKTLRLEFKLPGEVKQGQVLALGPLRYRMASGNSEEDAGQCRRWALVGTRRIDMKAGIAFFIYAMRALRDLSARASQSCVARCAG